MVFTTWAQDWEVKPAHVVVCRACGCGDNTIGRWTRWCVVPLIVGCFLLFYVGELNFDLFLTSSNNLTATVESNAATEKKKAWSP